MAGAPLEYAAHRAHRRRRFSERNTDAIARYETTAGRFRARSGAVAAVETGTGTDTAVETAIVVRGKKARGDISNPFIIGGAAICGQSLLVYCCERDAQSAPRTHSPTHSPTRAPNDSARVSPLDRTAQNLGFGRASKFEAPGPIHPRLSTETFGFHEIIVCPSFFVELRQVK